VTAADEREEPADVQAQYAGDNDQDEEPESEAEKRPRDGDQNLEQTVEHALTPEPKNPGTSEPYLFLLRIG
jgi:hypothetical protein